jgi:hypothetical protein
MRRLFRTRTTTGTLKGLRLTSIRYHTIIRSSGVGCNIILWTDLVVAVPSRCGKRNSLTANARPGNVGQIFGQGEPHKRQRRSPRFDGSRRWAISSCWLYSRQRARDLLSWCDQLSPWYVQVRKICRYKSYLWLNRCYALSFQLETFVSAR